MEDKEFLEYAEKELALLESINKKLDKIVSPCKCTKCEEHDEEDEIMNFLNSLTEELGIKDKVTISKVVID